MTVEQGTTTTIKLEGERDMAQRDGTPDAIDQVLEARPECLVIDLSRLSFIDSSGVHWLIEAHKRCAEQGTHLVIVPGSRSAQQLFEICGLTRSLPFATEARGWTAHAFIDRPLEYGRDSPPREDPEADISVKDLDELAPYVEGASD